MRYLLLPFFSFSFPWNPRGMFAAAPPFGIRRILRDSSLPPHVDVIISNTGSRTSWSIKLERTARQDDPTSVEPIVHVDKNVIFTTGVDSLSAAVCSITTDGVRSIASHGVDGIARSAAAASPAFGLGKKIWRGLYLNYVYQDFTNPVGFQTFFRYFSYYTEYV